MPSLSRAGRRSGTESEKQAALRARIQSCVRGCDRRSAAGDGLLHSSLPPQMLFWTGWGTHLWTEKEVHIHTHTHTTKQRLNSNIYNTIKDEITPWFIMVQWRFYLNCGGDFVSACGEALCFVLYRNHSFSSESMISIRPLHWRCSLSAVLLVSHILLKQSLEF